jgi:hypothetical protein
VSRCSLVLGRPALTLLIVSPPRAVLPLDYTNI